METNNTQQTAKNKKNNGIDELLNTSMQNLKSLVDASTIIGEPMHVADGVTIIPVSKVSFGFASGGSDISTAKPKDLFGGGSGGGVTIAPIAFLVINNGVVKLMQIDSKANSVDKAINMVPDVIDKVSEVVSRTFQKPTPADQAQPE
ncbi:MAG: GerW family sporulation protein [Oscillospiraceae bacterium]